MKLLLDNNLSWRLVDQVADIFPGSLHVGSVDMSSASDIDVWEYARANGLTIVAKDSDFSAISMVRGFPPSVIWIRRGNCSTADIETILRRNAVAIFELGRVQPGAILELA